VNTLIRSTQRSGFIPRWLCAPLLLCALSLSSYADVTPPPQATPLAEPTPAEPPTSTQELERLKEELKALRAQVSEAQAAQADQAAPTDKELAKEQRLEELRYKHLWIAYSVVWLVIFFFLRSTWKRSEAVAARLEELKERVKRAEGEG
jgi:hypothetical protein